MHTYADLSTKSYLGGIVGEPGYRRVSTFNVVF